MRKRPHHRRQVERIRLLPHLEGLAGSIKVELTEIGMGGARLQHFTPLHVGHNLTLRFHWRDEEVAVPSSVIRCSVERFGGSSAFISGVRFLIPPGASRAPIKRLIEYYVKNALDTQVENAKGVEPGYSSRLMQSASQGDEILSLLGNEPRVDAATQALRDEGYVCYTYADGRWAKAKTWDAQQPREGFTIWHFEDDEQAELLCRDYENAPSEVRAVIRLCAELSLVPDDRLPPQKFIP